MRLSIYINESLFNGYDIICDGVTVHENQQFGLQKIRIGNLMVTSEIRNNYTCKIAMISLP